MTTPSSLPLRSSPLMFREFQKFQENRRKISSLTKPLVKKLRGADVWVCSHRNIGPHGFGATVSDAYKNWKAKVDQWC
jgi:hypothetical protein